VSPGRSIIILGIVLVVIGALVEFAPGLRLGRLPGDLRFGSGNVRFFLPLGTSIALSVIFTLVLALFRRR